MFYINCEEDGLIKTVDAFEFYDEACDVIVEYRNEHPKIDYCISEIEYSGWYDY